MAKVIGVRFKKAGKTYYFDPDGLSIKKGDCVIVETIRGVEFGEVVMGEMEVADDEIVMPLKKVIRVATDEDKIHYAENKEREKKAFDICLKKIQEHGMAMKLVDVEYTFDNNKIIFYFTAEGRVDFRDLVKDLASVFKTRIELRQIGVRDEAKIVGGMGPCGRPLCCKVFLGEFEPVSIKMAKDQGLTINPSKISGLCGRLMCCLNFEQPCYEQLLETLPRVNDLVMTPDDETGTICEINAISRKVKVKIIKEDGIEIYKYFNTDEVVVVNKYDEDYDCDTSDLESLDF
ncbi:PSP1 domain-containing protein [Caldanaerobius polysaccharolyticus]|uniref:PSP1 domain-containing protein n=1 Tax=Caldanaerobius polysaccharolyticus TaxID=44256 RepID=UPI000478887A|nr:stage 0 sporulation family protein [Caldanaerobius polysaccharolyticus]